MTNTQRISARNRARVLAALGKRSAPASGVARRLNWSVSLAQEVLSELACAGRVHAGDKPQYPNGPTWPVWYAGPVKTPTHRVDQPHPHP